MVKLFKKSWILTLFLISLLIFLLLEFVPAPLLSVYYHDNASCNAGYCHCNCSCYDPVGCDCECAAGVTRDGWYYWCYAHCYCETLEPDCCEDPPKSDPDYPVRYCPRAK